MTMEELHGTIVSAALGTFGRNEIRYGYIGLETTDGKHVKIKVDTFTWYETLEVGNKVVVELESLGTTNILIARKIMLRTDSASVNTENAEAAT